uniref:Uncharacterized protein n=1 Tax=Parascaris equorum TaxID=6256 RepID=A0A914RXK3_PAREQ
MVLKWKEENTVRGKIVVAIFFSVSSPKFFKLHFFHSVNDGW